MNKILIQIEKIINDNICEHLPDVSPKKLEARGKVFYMNGKNGTEFDWYVNGHLPCFMVFYNDRANLGAAKLSLYDDGGILLYLYDDHGRRVAKEVKTFIDVPDSELLDLAVLLRNNADDKRIWDKAIDKIDTDGVPTDKAREEFIKNAEAYMPMIERKYLMSKFAVVSRKIIREGYNVGYMVREEPHDEQDSGWMMSAGDEDDEYINNIENLELVLINNIANLDPAIMSCIDAPAGTSMVRVSEDVFEPDEGQKSFVSVRE